MNAVYRSDYLESLQQPYHHDDDDDAIKDAFNLPVHRDVDVDEKKQHANDDQDDYYVYKGHEEPPYVASKVYPNSKPHFYINQTVMLRSSNKKLFFCSIVPMVRPL